MKTTILATAALLYPLTTWAADETRPFDVKPGLWETTSTMEMSGMPAMPAMPQIPPEQLAKMTPQQRAQVEAMMKSSMGAGGARTSTNKSCMTKEMLQRGIAMNPNENCTTKVTSSSASTQNIHMECNQAKTTMTGDMVLERIDSEHAKGSVVMKSPASAGQPTNIDMKMSFNTKWVSSDCGDVKPVVIPK